MVNQMIFQIDSSIVKEKFKEDNYTIKYDKEISEEEENKLCAIYFSSHEIYFPNTYAAFEYSILKRDKYEWMGNKLPNAHKHIFIRDIKKQWYLNGINDKLNHPLKVLEFLRNETKGYRVITIGSSAGGYAALLFGNLLTCERVYAFNASLNLFEKINTSNAIENPILFSKRFDKEMDIYFDLGKILTTKSDNYYFQSCLSMNDVNQFDSLKKENQSNLKIIRFKTSNHGIPFLRINLKNVLTFTASELDSYVNTKVHPLVFSINLIGLISTFNFTLKAVKNKLKKKTLEVLHKISC
jgi:hypothetical protein